MLHLYNLEKVRIKGLKAYKDYCIESDLSTGDKTLSFLYPSKLAKDIKEECYIRNKNHEFVVKEITEQNDWKNIKATLNVEDLEGQPWEHFETIEKTIEECLTLAVAGTGWTVDVNGITKRRTIRKTNCSSWDIIQQVKKTYLVEIEFDTINKKVIVAEKLGSDKGTYFMDTINLRELAIQSNSYDFYTRIIAIGKDGIKATVENYQYSSKKKTLIWKDERYTDIKSLTEDATAKLNEISKPYRSYAADIIDLASINDKYSILSYSLGDTIYLISKDKGIKEKQRIIKTAEYPDETHRNTCEIANSILSFADIQKEYQLTSDTVDNITSDDGTISEDAIKVAVEHLTVNKVDIGDFNAVSGRVGELEVSKLDVNTATIKFAEIDEAIIKKANITDLTAGNIKVDIIEGGTAILQDILTNFISGENGQFIHLTGSNVVIDNAVIKDAMIDTISAGKISAGTMSTNKFTISSDSGNLVIADNTIQIKDGIRVRVQIGKDASNDYNMYLWDSTGKLMFDALGLKADGIKDKIIRNDMVSDSANISGGKLDIDSVIVEVNTNGTETFKSSKIKMDLTGQTLDVAFTKISEDAAGAVETANSAQSAVTIANEKIETLVRNTTIVKEDGTTVQLKDAYISTKQTVEGMTTTVSNLETTVNGENGLTSKMQIVEQKVTATGITTTISEAINAGTNNITTTQFTMDKTGFIVKNGALKILNKANETVLCGDSNGDLRVSGTLIIGGNDIAISKGELLVKNANNDTILVLDKTGMLIKEESFNIISQSWFDPASVGNKISITSKSIKGYTRAIDGTLKAGAEIEIGEVITILPATLKFNVNCPFSIGQGENYINGDTLFVNTENTYFYKNLILNGENLNTTLAEKGDYANGTWTPVLYCSTGSSLIISTTTNFAIYHKIGKLVRVYFSISIASWDTTLSSNSLLIRGLPYVRDLNRYGVGTITVYTGMKTPVKALGLTAHVTAHNSWWIRRQTDVTFGNLQLSYLEQAFTLEGWMEYSTV